MRVKPHPHPSAHGCVNVMRSGILGGFRAAGSEPWHHEFLPDEQACHHRDLWNNIQQDMPGGAPDSGC
jgi:hypothetical protein